VHFAPDPNCKVLVRAVEEVIKYGADAVSVHVNVGAQFECEMIATLGQISERCDYWGMSLRAMMYPRCDKVEDEHDVRHVKLARVGAELMRTLSRRTIQAKSIPLKR
jgi:fructose-bisphosphate aldolase/2-amino-3,7-dideoxy-D-threo-hept-6-ulosonate synthase